MLAVITVISNAYNYLRCSTKLPHPIPFPVKSEHM